MFSTYPISSPIPSLTLPLGQAQGQDSGQALAFARQLAEGIPFSRPALLKGEVELFLNVLRSDAACRELLTGLLVREEDRVMPYVAAITYTQPAAGAPPLGELATPARRAALGLLLIESILQDRRSSSLDTGNRLTGIGRRYQPRGHGDGSDAQALSNFVRVFVAPILYYLAYERNTGDLVRTTLLRYKQRCEWFERDRLMEIAQTKDARNQVNLIEKRLKADLYRCLFDSGMEFAVDPYTPPRSAKPDLVSAKLPDGHKLVLEVKAYDGAGSSAAVSEGIKQAKCYADEWGEPVGYCLVYNVATRATLEIAGAQWDGEFYTINLGSKQVRLIIINLSGLTTTTLVSGKIRRARVDVSKLER